MLTRKQPFIIGIGLYVCLNAILWLLANMTPLGTVLDYYIGNNLTTKIPELQKSHPQKLDVLVLGSSITNNGFSPLVFEKQFNHKVNSFNMGLHGARPDVFRLYLERHIQQYGKPKVVLVELTDNNLISDNYYMPSSYYLNFFKTDPRHWSLLLTSPVLNFSDRKEMVLSALSPIYAYRGVFSPVNFQNRLNKQWQKWQPPQTTHLAPKSSSLHSDLYEPEALKGWEPGSVSAHLSTENGLQNELKTMTHQTLDTVKTVDLSKLSYFLSYCQQNHIPVFMVSWPTHPRYQHLLGATSIYPQYQKILQHYAQAFNAPIITLGEPETSETKLLFQDGRHLSAKGAAKYTSALATQLKKLSQFNNAL